MKLNLFLTVFSSVCAFEDDGESYRLVKGNFYSLSSYFQNKIMVLTVFLFSKLETTCIHIFKCM